MEGSRLRERLAELRNEHETEGALPPLRRLKDDVVDAAPPERTAPGKQAVKKEKEKKKKKPEKREVQKKKKPKKEDVVKLSDVQLAIFRWLKKRGGSFSVNDIAKGVLTPAELAERPIGVDGKPGDAPGLRKVRNALRKMIKTSVVESKNARIQAVC